MKRKLFMTSLLAVSLSVAALAGDSQRLITFEMKAVTADADTVITWLVPSSGIYIQNDSDNAIFFLFGTGAVDAEAGAGGGALGPYQGGWFPIKTYRLAIRCRTENADVRVWVYKP